MKHQQRKSPEYRGGYCLVPEGHLLAIIRAYRDGSVKKDGFRVFAAILEKGALHAKSKVDLFRILNCRAQQRGIKRLRLGIVREGEACLSRVLTVAPNESQRLRAVSRIGLRAIAQGRMTCTEAVVFFMYSSKRITQRKPLKRLLPDERYARFTYRELFEMSGVPRANISRAVGSLKGKGFLNTVWVVKQNENQFGLLFVDGQLLTVTPGAAADRSQSQVKKTTTPSAQNNNTSMVKLPTLKNSYPKSLTEKNNCADLVGNVRKNASDWERIQMRARAMKENQAEQAA